MRIEIQDHGLGFPADAQPHLFGKFYRVDNSDRRSITGTGLGLAICRQIIAEHGGAIGAVSLGLGQGSLFWLTLPAVSAKQEESREREPLALGIGRKQ